MFQWIKDDWNAFETWLANKWPGFKTKALAALTVVGSGVMALLDYLNQVDITQFMTGREALYLTMAVGGLTYFFQHLRSKE